MTAHLRQPLPPALAELRSRAIPSLIDSVDQGFYRHYGKRLLDLVASLLMLPVALLVILPFAILIAFDGASPFYRQKRVGRDGRIFFMWKLRSMVPDAERRLEAHLAADPEARAEWTRDQKLRRDPRITRVGRLIRKTSIDELPQLWNVLRGDMSIVGPRPMMPQQREIYPGIAYFALRPGLTGYWQTSARNEASFAQRALYDTCYFRDLSLATDIRLVLRTVPVLVSPNGH